MCVVYIKHGGVRAFAISISISAFTFIFNSYMQRKDMTAASGRPQRDLSQFSHYRKLGSADEEKGSTYEEDSD